MKNTPKTTVEMLNARDRARLVVRDAGGAAPMFVIETVKE